VMFFKHVALHKVLIDLYGLGAAVKFSYHAHSSYFEPKHIL
jgi:hypothetical protein